MACLLQPTAAPAESIVVRCLEGLTHGFLVLRTQDGKHLADGDSTQVVRSDRVTNHLTFRFNDGSIYEETTIFSQRGTFRLVSNHVLKKGPAFTLPMESSIDTTTGEVSVRFQDDHGKEKFVSQRMKLPPDLANGMLFTLLKNIQLTPSTRVSYLETSLKPRLVGLVITPEEEDAFTTGSTIHKATQYVVKVEIGGVAGVIAPLIGKHPPDIHVWVLGGEAPAFVGSEGPLYGGGPVWRIELVGPVLQRGPNTVSNK